MSDPLTDAEDDAATPLEPEGRHDFAPLLKFARS
jgi:hypothetical protein